MHTAASPLKRRLLGAAFFASIALFVGWSITQYQRTFEPVVEVQLATDTVGNALRAHSDVKVRGVIVGEVRATEVRATEVRATEVRATEVRATEVRATEVGSTGARGGEVVVTLALDPDKAAQIPSNVTARLLPKTLFGERYIALQMPSERTPTALGDGSVIWQDSSGNAIELGELLDRVEPLLEAVPPESLSSVLGALSQALDGNGASLGATVDRLEHIFDGLNSELPSIQDDIRGLADLAQTYSSAAPDLVDALDNLSTTGNTIVERRNDVDQLLRSAAAASSDTADFVEGNAASIISLSADSREAVELLAEFSPSTTCMLRQLAVTSEEAKNIIAVDDAYPGARGTVSFVTPRGRYLPNQDEPRLFDNRGPSCFPHSTASGNFFPQYPGSAPNFGAYNPPSRNPGPVELDALPVPQNSGVSTRSAAEPATAQYAGSDAERDTLAVVYGSATGTRPADVPGWASLIGAPALRGQSITVP